MKTSFFLLCLFAANVVVAAVGDSIVVNVGKRSAITFYGKTTEDLRQIERLDLNKVFQNARRQYERMNQDSLQIRVVDEQNRQQYLFGLPTPQTPAESIKNLTRWQRYKRNTFVNVYVGFNPRIFKPFYKKPNAAFSNSFSATEFLSVNFPEVSISTVDEFNLTTRSVVQLGFDHESKLLDRKKTRLAFRYGVGMSFTSLEVATKNIAYYPTNSLNDKTLKEIEQLGQKLYDSGYGFRYGYYDFRGISSYFQAMPKIYLKNRNNEETWHLGLGIRLNMNGFLPSNSTMTILNSNSINNIINPQAIINTRKYYIESGYDSYTYSFLAELGYKNWAIWANYEPRFMRLHQNNYTESGGTIVDVQKKYMNNFTLGIKYGR